MSDGSGSGLHDQGSSVDHGGGVDSVDNRGSMDDGSSVDNRSSMDSLNHHRGRGDHWSVHGVDSVHRRAMVDHLARLGDGGLGTHHGDGSVHHGGVDTVDSYHGLVCH